MLLKLRQTGEKQEQCELGRVLTILDSRDGAQRIRIITVSYTNVSKDSADRSSRSGSRERIVQEGEISTIYNQEKFGEKEDGTAKTAPRNDASNMPDDASALDKITDKDKS